MTLLDTCSTVHILITCQMILSRTIQSLIEFESHNLGHKDLLIETLLLQDTLRFVKRSVIENTDVTRIDYESLRIGVCTAHERLTKMEKRVMIMLCEDGKDESKRAGKAGVEARGNRLEEHNTSYHESIKMTRPLQVILLSPIFPDISAVSTYEDGSAIHDWRSVKQHKGAETEQIPGYHDNETPAKGDTVYLQSKHRNAKHQPDNQPPETNVENQGAREHSSQHHAVPSNIATRESLAAFIFHVTFATFLFWWIMLPPSEHESDPTHPPL